MTPSAAGSALGFLALVAAALGKAPEVPPLQDSPPPETVVSVEPEEIRAGMFFNGGSLRVQASVPPGVSVAVLLSGDRGPLVMNRKGKVMGLIWMNVGTVEFPDVPHVYLLATSGSLPELAAPEALDSLGLGYETFAPQAAGGILAESGEEGGLFEELVRLKESEGLFAVREGDVTLRSEASGGLSASVDFRLPARAPAGGYRVAVYGFGPEASGLLGTAEVRLTQVGLAALISSLAIERGLLYGILAVVVAIAVGLLTGVAFGAGGKKGH